MTTRSLHSSFDKSMGTCVYFYNLKIASKICSSNGGAYRIALYTVGWCCLFPRWLTISGRLLHSGLAAAGQLMSVAESMPRSKTGEGRRKLVTAQRRRFFRIQVCVYMCVKWMRIPRYTRHLTFDIPDTS